MTTPRFLIDTHCWIWWNAQQDRLPSKVIEVITDKHNENLVCNTFLSA